MESIFQALPVLPSYIETTSLHVWVTTIWLLALKLPQCSPPHMTLSLHAAQTWYGFTQGMQLQRVLEARGQESWQARAFIVLGWSRVWVFVWMRHAAPTAVTLLKHSPSHLFLLDLPHPSDDLYP